MLQISKDILLENYPDEYELIRQGEKNPQECYILVVGLCLVSVDGTFKSKMLEIRIKSLLPYFLEKISIKVKSLLEKIKLSL